MKKVIRLTENDVARLVKRVIKESDNDFMYLSMGYSTGEEDYGDEDYDDSQYVEGLVLSKIPRDKFISIMGTDDIEEIVMFQGDESYDLIDEMLHNYDLSINTLTGQKMSPDIEDAWTQGVITVETSESYNRMLMK